MARAFFPGDPVPWFRCATTSQPQFSFDSVAGRHVAMLFYGAASTPRAKAALAELAAAKALFDDRRVSFFGVTVDPSDAAEGRIAESVPGIRHFMDADLKVSELYGRVARNEGGQVTYAPLWIVLDPRLRVLFAAPIEATGEVLARIARLDAPAASAAATPTPVLMVPRVFEPELCRHLIGLHEAHGGTPSGFMREIDGRTVAVNDASFKRRTDYHIEDQALREQLRNRLRRRLIPEIEKAFQFTPTRIERYLVACYDGEDSGFFRAHRDNTTPGTAHRRFAVTMNLNAEDFEGGELAFPEFGERGWRAPTGGAIVFSCSLLHEARPVTRGRRYAFLPFLYDEAGAEIRAKNMHLVDLEERDSQEPAAVAE